MTGRRLRRAAALLVGLSLPSAIVFTVLAAAGVLAIAPAIAAGTAAAALTWGVAIPGALAAGELRDAMAALAAEPVAAAEIASHAPRTSAASPLWAAFYRLLRLWRDRLTAAEARLAAAEAIIAAAPDPLILVDAKRQIVRANAPAAAFVGRISEPRDLAAALRNPALLAATDAVLRGEAVRTVEFAVSVPVEHWLRARIAGLSRPALDGAVAILSLSDITELKRAEQMRADFIANASHELKTPLAALLGFIETLQGPARADVKARERFLPIMQQQTLRMARLVDDLLSLSRIELNEHVAPTGRVALEPLLKQVADSLELRAAARGMRIVMRMAPDLPEAIGDRDELAQVFQNLLDNAIKYGRGDSEIAVDAAFAAGREHRPGSPSSGASFLRVAVEDRGDGIAADHVPRLTERFYRADTARSREMGGTGLGLAIVKHIVNRHRGRLEIASTPGVGSVFAVSLRAAPPRAETTPGAACAGESAADRHRTDP